jgi:dynein heavy chain
VAALQSCGHYVTRNSEIVKAALLLTGTLNALSQQIAEYCASFNSFGSILRRNRRDALRHFVASKPSLAEYRSEFEAFDGLLGDVDATADRCVIGPLEVGASSLKAQLKRSIGGWKAGYGTALRAQHQERLGELLAEADGLLKRIGATPAVAPTSILAVPDALATLRDVRIAEAAVEDELGHVQAAFALLEEEGLAPAIDTAADAIHDLRGLWRQLRAAAAQRFDAINGLQGQYRVELAGLTQRFGVEILCFRNDFEANGPAAPNIAPTEAMERLRRFGRTLEDKRQRWERLYSAEGALAVEERQYPELARTVAEMTELTRLYRVYAMVTSRVAELSTRLWRGLDVKSFVEQVQELQDNVRRLPSSVRHWAAYAEMRRLSDSVHGILPVMELLALPSIRERHWREVMRVTGTTWDLDPELFAVSHLIGAGILPHRDAVMDLAAASEKEADIEGRLQTLAREWKERTFVFAEFKHRGMLTLRSDDAAALKEQLEDSLVSLGSMVVSRFCVPFRSEASLWMSRLSQVSEAMTLWLEVQATWMHLEAVFAAGDIMKQLPHDAKRFALTDKQWVKLMHKASEVGSVVDFCVGSEVLKTLPFLQEQLEHCQRALSTYLEQKRSAFARFYFVSDGILLEVLSQASDPRAVQPHLQGFFDGVDELGFDPTQRKPPRITNVKSVSGEVVALLEPVVCAGNIEDWLEALSNETQRSIRFTMRDAVSEISQLRSSPANAGKFLLSTLAQVAATLFQVAWTEDITNALFISRPQERKETSRSLQRMRDTLADLGKRSSLTECEKTHLENVTTLAVHNQEVWEQSVKRCRDANSFEWTRQLRFYWTERMCCELRIADTEMVYCDELLATRERLVITPLTDRCYVALTQALALHLGGAPAGPAGTGKTETVKDLGRTAGKYVVVFNCSDQFDVRSMAKVFKGLAMSGCWGCFDEFNRITLPVLSVVAQQVHTVLLALKQHKSELVFTDGTTIKIRSTCGLFITMNPGYAGRQELPENLKILFRGVTMMVPDRQAIMKVKLAAAGYRLDAALARKFTMLYHLCEQQLSKRRHYDFGLRSILAVLRSAGDALRRESIAAADKFKLNQSQRDLEQSSMLGRSGGGGLIPRPPSASMMPAEEQAKAAPPPVDEEALFLRTVRSMNLSKLVFEDVPVFESLLADLFPNKSPGAASFPAIERSLGHFATSKGLVATPEWFTKCLQIYETKLVRHGIMVVGPAGSGKSVAMNAMLSALSDCERRHRQYRMNPKAITAGQMFGRVDDTTGDWHDGVFSFLWRRANRDRSNSVWLVCDGPVDTIWVESLNTVLDDNKLLTLANGDRVLMAPTVKMVFEVENLENASPATVSRAGMVYFSLEDIGWEPGVRAAIAALTHSGKWSEGFAAGFSKVVLGHFDALFRLAETASKLVAIMALTRQHLSLSAVQLSTHLGVNAAAAAAEGGGGRSRRTSAGDHDQAELGVAAAWFGLAWACGGALDEAGRTVVADYIARTFIDLGGESGIFGFMPHISVDSSHADSSAAARGANNVSPFPGSSEGRVMSPGLETNPLMASHAATAGDLASPAAARATPTMHWHAWDRVTPEWDSGTLDFNAPSVPLNDLFIPTADTTAAFYLLTALDQLQQPALIYGPSGSAKTAVLSRFLRAVVSSEPTLPAGFGANDAPSTSGTRSMQQSSSAAAAMRNLKANDERFTWTKLNISRATTPGSLQTAVEEFCEKRMGSTYGPKRNRVLCLLVDDLHMAEGNEWGDRETMELLRQLIETGGFYNVDRIGEWKRVVDVRYYGAATVKGGQSAAGGAPIPPRLLRHLTLLHFSLPPLTTLRLLYGSVLTARFARTPHLAGVVDSATDALLELWSKAQVRFLPTPSRFHYAFNLRDLSAAVQGMTLCALDSVATAAQLVDLWAHECWRTMGDKLNSRDDVEAFGKMLASVAGQFFPAVPAPTRNDGPSTMYVDFGTVDFMELTRDDDDDDAALLHDDGIKDPRHRGRQYAAISEGRLKDLGNDALAAYRHKRAAAAPSLDLVLFNSALEHVARLSRVLATPRGSALLIGVAGSGKQSLTRLAAFIHGFTCFQPTITTAYNAASWLEDLRAHYTSAGVQGPCVFIVADQQVKHESFLENVNAFLTGGEIPGLFAAEDRDSVLGTVRHVAKSQSRRTFQDSEEWLWNWFVTRVRQNLRFVLCFSSQGDTLRQRARWFPGIFDSCCVIVHMPWPADALALVARSTVTEMQSAAKGGITRSFSRSGPLAMLAAQHEQDEADAEDSATTGSSADARMTKLVHGALDVPAPLLPELLTEIHEGAKRLCDTAFEQQRQRIFCTPKMFLSLLDTFRRIFNSKTRELKRSFGTLALGLDKMKAAENDVTEMRAVLDKKEALLREAQEETDALLQEITIATQAAESQKVDIAADRDTLAREAAKITDARESAQQDLRGAEPALNAAREALEQITANDMKTLKALQKPPEMVRRIFDGVCILLHHTVDEVQCVPGPKGRLMLQDSWQRGGKGLLSRMDFLDTITGFNSKNKDRINDETCELLQPYLWQPDFSYERARSACGNVAGLCTWVRAMETYRRMSKYVAPKIEALDLAERRLDLANQKLESKQVELARAEENVRQFQAKLQDAKDRKQKLEEDAANTRRRMRYATDLIVKLKDEKERWQEQFAGADAALAQVAGTAVCCASIVTYAGPFDVGYRAQLTELAHSLCKKRRLPVAQPFSLVSYLGDEQRLARWVLNGLPADDQSSTNVLIIGKCGKVPILVDPQEQAVRWLQATHRGAAVPLVIRKATSDDLQQQVELQMRAGGAFIVTEFTRLTPFIAALIEALAGRLDPLADVRKPSADADEVTPSQAATPAGKASVAHSTPGYHRARRASRRSSRAHGSFTNSAPTATTVNVLGEVMDLHPEFRLFFATKRGSMDYSPETYAMAAVVDFAVTESGLEQQLLARVIRLERAELESQKSELMVAIHEGAAQLRACEAELLAKLTSAQGSLVDDESLILTLSASQSSAIDIKRKLETADRTRQSIDAAREDYRVVAQRGSQLYFVASELAAVSPAYQLSLLQYVGLFDGSVRRSPPSPSPSVRIKSVLENVTEDFFAFVGRGLYSAHKPLLSLLIALKVGLGEKTISPEEQRVLLRGGTQVDDAAMLKRPNPAPEWLRDGVWRGCVAAQLALKGPLSKLAELLGSADVSRAFREFVDAETEEAFDGAVAKMPTAFQSLRPFERFLLVRLLREDRMHAAAMDFVAVTLGEQYREVPPHDVDAIVDEVVGRMPVLFLLSSGSDPTAQLEAAAKARRRQLFQVSLGSGQEAAAAALLDRAVNTGSWVVFQNCHLGVPFLRYLEDWATSVAPLSATAQEARVWITSEPTPDFPLTLLQMCLKLTNDPPVGMHAAASRAMSSAITRDCYEQFRRPEWRPCLAALVYFHACLLERRKYRPVGWSVPYAFDGGDLAASLAFLTSYFGRIGDDAKRGDPVAWDGIRFMIADVQYGGRVTGARDRAILQALAENVFSPHVVEPKAQLLRGCAKLTIPDTSADITVFRKSFVAQFSANEPPPSVGLGPFAQRALNASLSEDLLSTLLSIQPRSAARGTAGETPEQATARLVTETLKRIPDPLSKRDVAEVLATRSANTASKRKKRRGATGVDEDEVDAAATAATAAVAPLDIFFSLEAERTAKLIGHARSLLHEVLDGLSGAVVMTPEASDAVQALIRGLVPPVLRQRSWEGTPTFAAWTAMLLRRHSVVAEFFSRAQLGAPGSLPFYDLTTMYNPAGFVQSVRQHLCHSSDGWVLDRVEARIEATRFNHPQDIAEAPDAGLYMCGVRLEGAGYDVERARLRQAMPRETTVVLPVMRLSAVQSSNRPVPPTGAGGTTAGRHGGGAAAAGTDPSQEPLTKRARELAAAAMRKPVRVPLYSSPARSDATWVCDVDLVQDEADASVWTERGIACVCSP